MGYFASKGVRKRHPGGTRYDDLFKMIWAPTVVLLLLVSTVTTSHITSSVEQAAQCLEELESNILPTSMRESWNTAKEGFFSAIVQDMHETDVSVLFEQLLSLQRHIKNTKKMKSWFQWRGNYWMVMTDQSLNITLTVTRFIISLQFLESSLLPEAMDANWKVYKRDDWLRNCSPLIKPSDQLAFYGDFYLNIQALLLTFGYTSLEEYNNEAIKAISVINAAAEILDMRGKISGSTEIAAGSLGITAGVVSILGLILAPFTAGVSLVLTAKGLVLSMGSSILRFSALIVQMEVDLKKRRKIVDVTNSISDETMAILHMLTNFELAADEMVKKMNITEFDGEELIKDIQHIGELELARYISLPWYLKNFVSAKNSMMVYRLKKGLGKLNAEEIAKGVGKKMSFQGAAQGIKIPWVIRKIAPVELPKYLVKSATSFASRAVSLSALSNTVSVGFGIWNIIRGKEKVSDTYHLSKDFRGLANGIHGAKNTILSAYGIDPRLAFTINFAGNVTDNKGRRQDWHRACFHGHRCVMLVLLSQSISAKESERICRKSGYHLFPLGSKRGSDVIVELLSRFGRSAWVSSSSTFADFAPGHPRYRGHPCLFLSKDHSFKVVDTGCKRTRKSAVLCC